MCRLEKQRPRCGHKAEAGLSRRLVISLAGLKLASIWNVAVETSAFPRYGYYDSPTEKHLRRLSCLSAWNRQKREARSVPPAVQSDARWPALRIRQQGQPK